MPRSAWARCDPRGGADETTNHALHEEDPGGIELSSAEIVDAAQGNRASGIALQRPEERCLQKPARDGVLLEGGLGPSPREQISKLAGRWSFDPRHGTGVWNV